jgi:hypothetical protein
MTNSAESGRTVGTTTAAACCLGVADLEYPLGVAPLGLSTSNSSYDLENIDEAAQVRSEDEPRR